MLSEIKEKITSSKWIINVPASLDRAQAAKRVAASIANGFDVFEVAINSREDIELLRKLKSSHASALVGAGSINNLESLKDAFYGGADFFASAFSDSDLIEFALEKEIFYIPGGATPSEMGHLLKKGFLLQQLYTGKNIATYQLEDLIQEFPNLAPVLTVRADNFNLASEKGEKLIFSGAAAIRLGLI